MWPSLQQASPSFEQQAALALESQLEHVAHSFLQAQDAKKRADTAMRMEVIRMMSNE